MPDLQGLLNKIYDEQNQALRVTGGASLTVVDAGSDLNTARPAGAAAVYWKFDGGVDPGTDGANVTNGEPGELYFVASA